MDEGLSPPSREWFDRGDRDLETARLLHDQEGYPEIIGYHIHQAMEKYLKGFLLHNGRRPPRIHDLDILLNLASGLRAELFDAYIDVCERATRFYLEDRYPPGPPSDYTQEEIGADLEQMRRLVADLRKAAGL